MAGNRLLFYCVVTVLIWNGILFENCVQGEITELCQVPGNEPLSHERKVELKKIEERFTQAKVETEKLDAKLKQHHKTSTVEELEKEYSIFVGEYDSFVLMMQVEPSHCDRLIIELEESIDYFINHILSKFAQTFKL